MLPEHVFIRSAYCNDSCECVEVAAGTAQRSGRLRDSKQPAVILEFSSDSWTAFLRGVKAGDLQQ